MLLTANAATCLGLSVPALASALRAGKSKNELRSTTPGDAKAALKIVTETHAHWEALIHPQDGTQPRPEAAKDFYLAD